MTSVIELISPAAEAEPRAVASEDWRRFEG
jgi:hypothetical protein